MLELAERVLALTGSRSPIVHRELPTDDPKQRRPNITRAQEQLGWEPTVPLAEGLERTVEHFRVLLAGRRLRHVGRALAADRTQTR
jgi:UDP-glucuronate decarboxylase